MDAVNSACAALAMGAPFLAIALILAWYYICRVLWGRKRKTRRSRSRFFWSTAGVGTALLGLSLIYRPRLLYAIEAQQRQVEEVDEDDNGDPDSPQKHLLPVAPHPPGRRGGNPFRAPGMSPPLTIYDTIEREAQDVRNSQQERVGMGGNRRHRICICSSR